MSVEGEHDGPDRRGPDPASRLVRELGWPQSVLLLWSARDLQPLLGQLDAADVTVVRIAPGETADLLRYLGRADLLLLDAEGFDDSVVTALSNVREMQPSLPVMLLTSIIVADFLDTEVHADPDLIRVIEHVVAEVRPGTIYVHSPNDTHQDHRAVHVATLSAARGVPRIFSYQSPSATNSFAPTKYVQIDQTVEGKVDVLSHYESQAHRAYLDPDLVRAVARYWARQLPASVVFAEPFKVVRAAEPSTL